MPEKNEPITRFRDGALNISVWRQEGVKDGRKWQMHNVTIERSYKEGEEWKYSTSLGRYDLLATALLLQRAYTWITKEEAAFRAAQNAQAENPEEP